MSHQLPYLIGLTGGIGSGKSTVSALFRNLGVDVIDADEISRQFTAKNSPLLPVLIDHFGQQILNSDMTLDRSALREKVFNKPEERAWLEALLHPAIRDEIQRQISVSTGPYVIVSIPLLLESGHYDFLNRILVVDVPEEIQLERTVNRDNNSPEQVRRIMATQASRHHRLENADDVIDNTMSKADLAEHIRQLHARYLQLSAQ